MLFALISVFSILYLAFHIHQMSPKKILIWIGILFSSIILFIWHNKLHSSLSKPKIRRSDISSFDDNWQFSFNQSNWIDVTLPHTPRLEPIEKVEQQWQGTCFYRKQLRINNISSHVTLRFDAAMHEADVWINNEHVARHLGGYLPFDIDIPVNKNRTFDILVCLHNTDNSVIPPGHKLSQLDFNYYGGLYRHVWLITKSSRFRLHRTIHIDYKNVTKTQAIMIVRFNIIGDVNDLRNCHVRFSLNQYEIFPYNFPNSNRAEFLIRNPRLWTPSKPNLYHFSIELLDEPTKNILFDEQKITIGIRSFEFRSDSGHLFINGEKSDYIVGTNRHQEYPYIGYALSDAAQYRDAYKIKQAGFNLVRCSHYPPSTAFLDACDHLGILVIDAIPGWQFFGNQTFENNSFHDIEQMIERDYNHPSIILWEVSLNESPMSKEFMQQAHELAKQKKPDGLTGGWIDEGNAYDVFIPARQHGYPPDYYENYRAKNDKAIFIAEYGDWEYFALKGNFDQKSENCIFKDELTSRHRIKDGEKRLLKQATNFQEAHNHNRRSSLTTRIIGDANWLMFDYKRGYADDIEASGIMDINRLPKFAYYFYQ